MSHHHNWCGIAVTKLHINSVKSSWQKLVFVDCLHQLIVEFILSERAYLDKMASPLLLMVLLFYFFFIFSTTFLFCFVLFTHNFVFQRTNFFSNLSIFILQISVCLYAVVSSFPSNVETNRIEIDDKDFAQAAFSGTRESEPELPPTDSSIEHPDASPDQSVTSSEESEDSINQYEVEKNLSELPISTSAPQESTPEGLPEMLLLHPAIVNMHQFQPRCGCRSNVMQHYVPRPSCGCRDSCPCNVGRMFPPSFATSSSPEFLSSIARMSPMMPPLMPQMLAMSSMPPMMPPMPSMPSMSLMPPTMPSRMMKVLVCSKKTSEWYKLIPTFSWKSNCIVLWYFVDFFRKYFYRILLFAKKK